MSRQKKSTLAHLLTSTPKINVDPKKSLGTLLMESRDIPLRFSVKPGETLGQLLLRAGGRRNCDRLATT